MLMSADILILGVTPSSILLAQTLSQAAHSYVILEPRSRDEVEPELTEANALVVYGCCIVRMSVSEKRSQYFLQDTRGRNFQGPTLICALETPAQKAGKSGSAHKTQHGHQEPLAAARFDLSNAASTESIAAFASFLTEERTCPSAASQDDSEEMLQMAAALPQAYSTSFYPSAIYTRESIDRVA